MITLPLLLALAVEPPVSMNNDVITLRTDIDGSSSETVIRYLKMGGTMIVVENSGGRDQASARKLAEAVQKAGAEVQVKGMCKDVCASYLFLTAPSKSVLEGGAIGMRDVTLDADYYDTLAVLADPKTVSTRAKENMLLARAAINPNLIKRAQSAANPGAHHASISYQDQKGVGVTYEDIGVEAFRNLVEILAKGQPKALETLKVHTRWDQSRLWFPTSVALESYGVTGIKSYAYPINAEAAAALTEKYGVTVVTNW